MEINKRFSSDVRELIRQEIKDAGGNEVFFTGLIDSNGCVSEVYACARGNIHSVPVHFEESRRAHVLIHNHPSGVLYPSDADLAVASDCSENAQGFYIINNDVSDVYVVLEPIKPVVTVRLDEDASAFFLSKNGSFANSSDFFEERPSQLELIKRITKSFNEDLIGVFEAGTGVGKSFAYLIPAMLWAVRNKERVVVSTGTINLQQQLIEKDIPLAEKIIGEKVKSILIKGRQNYVCLRRLGEIGKERDLFSDETEVFDKIASWSKETKTGSRTDLTFVPPENIWQKVNSEADACMGMRCPHRENCFVMKVRKEAADANILVVNHHLLFADIESRMEGAGYSDTAVLPPYTRVVFDEAHEIEDAATSFFSANFSRFKLLKQLNLLYRQRKGSAAGFLFTLSALSRIEDKTAEVEAVIAKAKESVISLENAAEEMLQNELCMRLYSATSVKFSRILREFSTLLMHLTVITGVVREIIEGIDEDDRDHSVVYESKSVLRRLDDMIVFCKNFNEWDEHFDLVFWIQKSRLPSVLAKDSVNPFYFQFYQTPLDIAPLMNKGVYEPFKTVVCTSATLSVSRRFDFWKKRVGISFAEKNRIVSDEFDSPFPYERNMIFAVPSDVPFPEHESFQSFIEDACVRLILNASGRTLLLFTSYDSLRHACDAARTLLRSSGINVLKQGDDDRFRLLQTFKEDTSSVLFATDSFWEGVDVPGESLSQVVIVKLPFGVPSDPVFAARAEEITKRGGSPFMELSVPEAIIKFRQGFGRLIRRGDDKGAVVVLDRRIIEKQYGKLFTSSIPECKMIYEKFDDMLLKIKKYY